MLEKTPKKTIKDLKATATPAPTAPGGKVEKAVIPAMNFKSAVIRIKGAANSPLVQNKFSSGNRDAMIAKQEAGSVSKKGQKRDPKDFNKVYRSAMHVTPDGSYGIPAPGLRSALISACKLCGFAMTRAKLSIFVTANAFDVDDGTPLVKIVGKPTRRDVAVRLATGSTDILPRPFFSDWYADVEVEWDADQFSTNDVIKLMVRAGKQVGIGAGRHDSKQSTGMGWGCFEVVQ